MLKKRKKIRYIFIAYWFLLAYTVAAIGWWFIELNNHNIEMYNYEIKNIDKSAINYQILYNEIINHKDSNTKQFIGEGLMFLIVIVAGAIFIFRRIIKELKSAKEQRNFLMAITHELKTPIAVSKLNLETIQKRKLSEEQQIKLVSNTLAETNRLASLCNNLLISYQIEGSAFKLSKEEINLSALLTDIVKNFKSHYPNRTVNSNITPELNVKADGFLLEIAINNLLENAAKYSPKEKPITIILQEQNKKAIIKVVDEGGGIADEEKVLVFNKFYRTGNAATKAAKGTGLGLYLADRICKTHDGKITIENNPKGGSIFTFALQIIE